MKLFNKFNKKRSNKKTKKGISNTDIIPHLSPKQERRQVQYKNNHLKNPIYKLPSIDDISLPDLSDKGGA
ncbi:hypothetical protein J056_004153 [Wallemia ichthyophaga EXF-994]|uniref:Uncharacterized protein n=1 Tax=Wallemia ichthyophaga (strain EXF-994 / CBS 113033) TaxID=1299270 RepID=R9AGR4_WALI9|nr:uncharacterized protein J056_004153 [Wallemia ichthyophaga EXF-994]EOR01367.1 hypothetical protein J056_004153 [Wallemia ichthyophaga EXF-994]